MNGGTDMVAIEAVPTTERCGCTTVTGGAAYPDGWHDLDGDGLPDHCLTCGQRVSVVFDA